MRLLPVDVAVGVAAGAVDRCIVRCLSMQHLDKYGMHL